MSSDGDLGFLLRKNVASPSKPDAAASTPVKVTAPSPSANAKHDVAKTRLETDTTTPSHLNLPTLLMRSG
jgi:hypothetical protein